MFQLLTYYLLGDSMNYLKRLGKVILSTLLSIIILNLILTTLYYFDIINNNIYNIMKMIIVLLSLFFNAFILSQNSPKYGIVEGLKLGTIFLLIMIIIKIITNSSFDIKTFIYSLIILLTTSVSSIIGTKKRDK